MKERKKTCKPIIIYNPNEAALLAAILQTKEDDRT